MGGSVNDRQPPWPNLSAQVTGVRGRREAGGLDVGELTTPSDSNFPRLGLPALPVGDLSSLGFPPSPAFSRTDDGTRDAARTTALYATMTLSPCEQLPGSQCLKQKRKLFPGPPPVSAG